MQLRKSLKLWIQTFAIALIVVVRWGGSTNCDAQEPGSAILNQLREKNVRQAFELLDVDASIWSTDDERGLVATGGGLFRALTQLSEDEQYNLLYQWTMPSAERNTVRIFTTYVPRHTPPEVFARVLREKPRGTSFPVSSINGVRGLFSTGWSLVRVADELGRLNRLTAELETLSREQVPNADVLLMLAKLADRRANGSELQITFQMLTDQLADAAQSADQNRPGVHSSNILLAVASLQHEALQPLGVALLQSQIEQTNEWNSPRLRTFLRLAHATAVQIQLGTSGPEFLHENRLKYWVPVSNETATTSALGTIPAMWLTHEEHILHLTGSPNDALFFRYPLVGEFDFTCETQEGGSELTNGGLVYGGLQYQALGSTNQLSVWDAEMEHLSLQVCPFVRHEPSRAMFHRVSIRTKDEQFQFAANLHPVWFDTPAALQSPWLGLRSHGEHRPTFRNFKLTGEPIIPREVSLTGGAELRGWQAQFFQESQPNFSPKTDANHPAVHSQTDWKMRSGDIEALKQNLEQGESHQSLLRYQRPLLDGESIGYEFFYQAEDSEVHPALGRLAFLLEPGGVRIHWITDGLLDWTGLPEDNATLEPLNRRGPRPLPLKENDWNEVKISRDEGLVTLSLNDSLIYTRPMDVGQIEKFGLYRDRSRAVRVRNVVLSGDWPEQVPQDFLENPTALIEAQGAKENVSTLHSLAGAEILASNIREIRRRSAERSIEERYDVLKRWVLPSERHPDFRMTGEFTPSDPSPLALKREPHRFPSSRGGEFVSPVFDLLKAAKELGRLEELFESVVALQGRLDFDQQRSMLCLQIMIRLEQGRADSIEPLMSQLHQALDDAFRSPTSKYDAELCLISHAIMSFGEFKVVGDLLGAFFENRYSIDVEDPWESHICALSGRYFEHLNGERQSENMKTWIPVARSNALSRGDGYPSNRWRTTENDELHLGSGHYRDFLFFPSPLSGDYEVMGEVCPGGRTQIMTAGLAVGPHGDRKSMSVARFRDELQPQPVDPPLKRHEEWTRYRAVVRDGRLRTYLNDRLLVERELGPNFDPWIAARGISHSTGPLRHLQIVGSPQIPEMIEMSSEGAFNSWYCYYLNESAGGEHGLWQWQPGEDGRGEIFAKRYPVVPGSGKESLLRYHRPLAEDGSVEYDFYYTPDRTTEAHPALDRLVFLLDPAGVKVHWLTDEAYDRTSLSPDNVFLEPNNQRGPENLPLKQHDWNHLKLTIVGQVVSLELNQQLIYERELEPSNLRSFGLFHYSDRSQLRVRNVTMRGDWPKSLPHPAQQELTDPRLVELHEGLGELPVEYYHDFVRDGLPKNFFKLTGRESATAVTPQADGVHVQLNGVSGWTVTAIMPQFQISGNFDIRTRFELKDLETNWQDGLAFLEVRLADDQNHYFRAMRGHQPDIGHNVRSQVMWGPLDERRRITDEVNSSGASSGSFRIARIGDELYSLFAPEGSDAFRILRVEKITDADIEMSGILLELALRDKSNGHVVWKDLSIKADRIRYLPPDQRLNRKLYAMSPDGNNLRILTDPAFNLNHLGSPAFSSDGTKIAVDMSTGSTTSSRIVVMNRDGSDLEDLGRGCMPSISKDGKFVVCSDPGSGVVMMDSDGTNRKTLDRAGWGAQFSPDGQYIAYGKSGNLTLLETATEVTKTLMTGDLANRYSSIYWNFGWSHDSRAIAFKGRVRGNGQEEMAVVALDKPDQVEVLYSGSGINPDFTFSPDNQSVLFAKSTPGQPGPQLYLAHRKTPGEIEYLKGQPTDQMIYDCEWSPDGREIVFSSVQRPGPVDWPIADRSSSQK